MIREELESMIMCAAVDCGGRTEAVKTGLPCSWKFPSGVHIWLETGDTLRVFTPDMVLSATVAVSEVSMFDWDIETGYFEIHCKHRYSTNHIGGHLKRTRRKK